MLRLVVLITPIVGVIIFPLIVPYIMAKLGIAAGILIALSSITLWFIAMLKTSEMPH